MRIFGLAGWSGSGKTTLVVQLIPALIARGITVSTVKHAHHEFDIDQPGKDSWRHREAGASEVMVASSRRWALMHEHRGAREPGLAALVAHLSPVDLVLVEGFKHEPHAKLEIHRPALGKPLLCPTTPTSSRWRATFPSPASPCRAWRSTMSPSIADFIIAHCRIEIAHGAIER